MRRVIVVSSMTRDSAKLAGAVAVFYVAFLLAGIFVQYLRTGEEYILHYSLSLPTTWIAVVAGCAIAYGLWRHRRWAWWLGIAGVIFQLLGISTRIARFVSAGHTPPIGVLTALTLSRTSRATEHSRIVQTLNEVTLVRADAYQSEVV
jgi:translocator protein